MGKSRTGWSRLATNNTALDLRAGLNISPYAVRLPASSFPYQLAIIGCCA
jgi:hypothetical protein